MAWSGSGIVVPTIQAALLNTKALDLVDDTIKVALYNNTVTPNYDSSDGYGDYGGEVTGTGWAAGGVTLSSKSLTVGAPAAGQLSFDADNVSESSTTLSNIYGCFIYDDTLTDKDIIVGVQFAGAPYSTTAGTLTITWHANGIFYLDLA